MTGQDAWTRLDADGDLRIHLAIADGRLCRLSINRTDDQFAAELARAHPGRAWPLGKTDPILLQVAAQLEEYLAGRRQEFDVPLDLDGTPFQQRVWRALLTIPYGETRSYQEVAIRIGSPNAVRAVGGANGKNPVAIVVPCHRVIAADGSLGGYGGGLPVKQRLLDLEANRWTPKQLSLGAG